MDMIRLVGRAACILCMAGAAQAATESFESPALTADFNWSGVTSGLECATYFTQDTGYCRGLVDGDSVGYSWNSVGSPASITSNIGAFDFNGVYITAAWENGLGVSIQGLSGGVVTYSQDFLIDDDAPLWTASNFVGIDELRIWTTPGVDAGTPGGGSFVALDLFTFNEAILVAPVPLPAGLPLLVAGLAGLGVLRSRRTA